MEKRHRNECVAQGVPQGYVFGTISFVLFSPLSCDWWNPLRPWSQSLSSFSLWPKQPTESNGPGGQTTLPPAVSSVLYPSFGERENGPVLIAIWSTAQGGEERVSVFFVKSIFFFHLSLSHLNLSPLQNIAQSSKTYSRIFLSKAVLSASLLIELMPGLKSQSCLFTLP